MTNFLRTLCVILIGISVGFLAYKKMKSMDFEKSQAMSNAGMVKKMILKYKKPLRIEVQNFVKSTDSRFQKDIQDIKNLKISLDANSNYYIELQMFTDESDSKAPLVIQCRFLDAQSKNLIQEQSLNLF